MENPTHRKHHELQQGKDFVTKRHSHKSTDDALDDDLYEPKKHVPTLFERFIDYDLKVSYV